MSENEVWLWYYCGQFCKKCFNKKTHSQMIVIPAMIPVVKILKLDCVAECLLKGSREIQLLKDRNSGRNEELWPRPILRYCQHTAWRRNIEMSRGRFFPTIQEHCPTTSCDIKSVSYYTRCEQMFVACNLVPRWPLCDNISCHVNNTWSLPSQSLLDGRMSYAQ